MINYQDANEVINYHQTLASSSERTSFMNICKDTAKFFYPDLKGLTGSSENQNVQSPDLFQSFSVGVADNFASNLYTTITNPTSQWFTWQLKDGVAPDDEVLKHLNEKTKLTLKELNSNKSNFNSKMLERDKHLGVFGNVVIHPFYSKSEKALRLTLFPIKEIYLIKNEEYFINDMHREFSLSAKQMYQRWGDKCNQEIIRHANDPNLSFSSSFEIINCIYKNDKYVKGSSNTKQYRYQSVFIDKKHKEVIHQEGFKNKPFAPYQWDQSDSNNAIYDSCPAMKSLADVKEYNKRRMSKNVAEGKIIDPPLAVNTQMYKGEGGVDTTQGAVNTFDLGYTGGSIKDQVVAINTVVPIAISIMNDSLDKLEDQIRGHFFYDFFRIMKDPSATATQVLEVKEESLRLMSPFVTSMSIGNDYLLNRVDALLEENGIFDNMEHPRPEDLSDEDIEIVYNNPTREAQKYQQLSKLNRTLEAAGAMGQMYPDVLDNLDSDEVFKQFLDVLGTTQFLKKQPEIDKVRRARQENASRQAGISDQVKMADAHVKRTTNEQQNYGMV